MSSVVVGSLAVQPVAQKMLLVSTGPDNTSLNLELGRR